MFKPETKILVTPSPERVFVLCRAILDEKKGGAKKDDIKNKIEVKSSPGYFNDLLNTAKELGLVKEEGGGYLQVAADKVDSLESFQTFCTSIALRLSAYLNGPIAILSQAAIQVYPELCQKTKSIKSSDETTKRIIQDYIDARYPEAKLAVFDDVKNMNGWRFWAAELGLIDYWDLPGGGWTYQPAPQRYLQILINASELPLHQKMTLHEFFEGLGSGIAVLVTDQQRKDRDLPYALAMTLDVLQDIKKIVLSSELDADMWSSEQNILKNISHIEILERRS